MVDRNVFAQAALVLWMATLMCMIVHHCHAQRDVRSAYFELNQFFDILLELRGGFLELAKIFEGMYTCQGLFSE
jgi:hypothetical protein